MEHALRELNLCPVAGRGYRAEMGRMVARVLGLWLGCVVALLAPAAALAAPAASVGGLRNPAGGVLELTVSAVSDVELVSATVAVDGKHVDTRPFPAGACRTGSAVACPAVATLTVVTREELPDGTFRTLIADGLRTVRVSVLDVSGAEFVQTSQITVDNAPIPNNPVVVVSVGSGNLSPSPPPPGGTDPPPAGAPTCKSPRLSMFLDERPLRYRRGVPVLKAGRKYRFEGRLTCMYNGRPRPAKRGTLVQVRNVVRGFTIFKPALEVGRNGRLVANLRFNSSRVLVFRVMGSGGNIIRVRIPLRVVKAGR